MPTICAHWRCGGVAVPDVAPHLCTEHADLVICPTCDDWRVVKRVWCPTCDGSGFCSPARAQWALDTCTRRRDRERHPAAGDLRWGSSPYEIDAPPETGREGPREPSGEGGGDPTPTGAPFYGAYDDAGEA